MVLVTGGSGYIGSVALQALREQGTPHVVLDNLSKGTAEAVHDSPLEQADIVDRPSLAKVFRQYPITAVMHFAALVSVTESIREPEKYHTVNCKGTQNLLEEMQEAGVKELVFSSTAAVYGEPQTVPIAEDHPTSSTNPYGESKLNAENLVKKASESWGLKATVFRYFNATGALPDQRLGPNLGLKEDLVTLAMRQVLGVGPELTIFGDDYPTADGTGIRDFIHVWDIALAHVAALRIPMERPGVRTLNLGTGNGFSVRQVLDCIREVTGHPLPVKMGPRRPGDPTTVIASSDLAKSTLGWVAQNSDLRRMISDTWMYQRDRAS